ncbi:17952_t:CDS:1, partial [Gigaspora margarita]
MNLKEFEFLIFELMNIKRIGDSSQENFGDCGGIVYRGIVVEYEEYEDG